MTSLPIYYDIFGMALLLFVIVVFAIYRSKVFGALKELLFDIVFAGIFTGASMAIFKIMNNTWISLMFFISLFVILSARIIYDKFFRSQGQPPPQLNNF
jgi:hypothetical protein